MSDGRITGARPGRSIDDVITTEQQKIRDAAERFDRGEFSASELMAVAIDVGNHVQSLREAAMFRAVVAMVDDRTAGRTTVPRWARLATLILLLAVIGGIATADRYETRGAGPNNVQAIVHDKWTGRSWLCAVDGRSCTEYLR